MASINLSLTEDCRLLTYNITAPANVQEGEEEGYEENENVCAVEIYNNGVLVSDAEVAILNFANGDIYTNTFTISVKDVIGSDPGIITVLVRDFLGNTDSAAILSSCELDCCLAEKVLDLTNCTDCDSKCSDQLVISQKIFLYMESIRTLLGQLGNDVTINQGIISQALDTYNAAKALCSGSCGCNC
tara:strand:- start:99 stop:659 length:561 start_codon:yes stop_codon:yes gene_type:complete